MQLLKDWKSIRRAFKKFDSSNVGVLNVSDFKRVLRSCGIQVRITVCASKPNDVILVISNVIARLQVSDDELFHILSEFDVTMEGEISYERFLNTLIDVA